MARRPSRSLTRKFHDLTETYEPKLRDAFRQAMDNVTDGADYQAVVRALIANDIEAAMRALNISAAAFRPFDLSVTEAFEAAGRSAVSDMPIIRGPSGAKITFRFDVRHPVVERRLQSQITGRIQGMTSEMEGVARGVLTQGLAEGRNPRRTASRLMGVINPATGKREGGLLTLASNQVDWVDRARAELESGDAAALRRFLTRTRRDRRFDRAVEKAISGQQSLSQEQIEKILNRYSDRLLRSRAEMVARTETTEALNSGKRSSYAQMADETGMDPNEATKKWIATRDNRTRDQHAAMNGMEITGLDTPFTMPDGSQMMHPCDSSLGAGASQTAGCRCTFSVRLNYMARAA